MEKRMIGGTGIEITEIGLGCWALGGGYWGEQDHKDSVKTIQAALRAGINHFDTAPVYGSGRSEQVTGQQLKRARERVIIATKSMYLPGNGVLNSIERSLKRMCTDYIDIFYIHWPKTGKDMRPMMEALEGARSSGKIRAIGVSNFSVAEMEKIGEAGRIDILQSGYNLLWRRAEKEIIPFCKKNNIAFTAYSPLAQGILTGKFERILRFKSGDLRARIIFFEQNIWPDVYNSVEKLKSVAEESGIPLASLVLKWTSSRPGITGIAAGARTRKQIEDNTACYIKKIDTVVLDGITKISDEINRIMPEADNIFRHST